ncbi:hypothetical protein TRVA0_024S01970 [Trichomonascus vanleenenianus]|uniref:NCBP3 domain-containing protein n=1 Tax=Trichomonascus vanleenenianus TaxID=2268995 RepID=UPI003ECB4EF1
MADLEIDLDDIDLRDEDFSSKAHTEVPSIVKEEAAEPVPEVAMDEDVPTAMIEDLGIIRPEAIHIKGVDSLSTKEVQEYVLSYFSSEPFRIAWVNDESVNVLFQSDEASASAFTALSAEGVAAAAQMERNIMRDGQLHPSKPARLRIRFALDSDRKAKGASQQSRYYKQHGRPSYEDERYRYVLPNTNRDEEYMDRDPKEIVQEDLFPQKAAEKYGVEPEPLGDDLFPDKLEQPKIGLISQRIRQRPVVRSRVSRSRSPPHHARRHAPREPREPREKRLYNEEKWIKGSRQQREESASSGSSSTDLRSRIKPPRDSERGRQSPKSDLRDRLSHGRKHARKAADLF